jgi:hypothetical protein
MPSINAISIDKLARLVGTPKCPVLIDVQTDEDFAADPSSIPGSIRRPWSRAPEWADTARPDLAPEAPGLLAASLGLSRMYADDLEQLDAGIALYDAFYRWCRDAIDETHNWPVRKPGA